MFHPADISRIALAEHSDPAFGLVAGPSRRDGGHIPQRLELFWSSRPERANRFIQSAEWRQASSPLRTAPSCDERIEPGPDPCTHWQHRVPASRLKSSAQVRVLPFPRCRSGLPGLACHRRILLDALLAEPTDSRKHDAVFAMMRWLHIREGS